MDSLAYIESITDVTDMVHTENNKLLKVETHYNKFFSSASLCSQSDDLTLNMVLNFF